MRKAKIPMNDLIGMVLASLKARMDPKTKLVVPSFLTMMRETHVCRQRIAEAVKFLQNEKLVEKVEVSYEKDGKRSGTMYYRILDA